VTRRCAAGDIARRGLLVFHPLTDPERIPFTKYCWSEKKTTRGSSIDTNAAVPFAAIGVHEAADRDRHRRHLGACPEVDKSHQQVVPEPPELENRQRGDSRHRGRRTRRKNICACVAPSRPADSIISQGSSPMKLRRRWMAKGSPYAHHARPRRRPLWFQNRVTNKSYQLSIARNRTREKTCTMVLV